MGDSKSSNHRSWVGLLLVSIGAYFLLRNFGLIPSFIPYYIFSWEMIFVLVGGVMLATNRREGFIFLGIGLFFLLPDVFNFPNFRIRDWWPIILIIVGVSIVLRRRDIDRRLEDANEDFIEEVSIFGGSEKSITSKNFKGGKITSLFGGSELNFLNSRLSPEREAIIDLFCMFGGNTLVVPSDWTVKMDATVIFGGYSEKRRGNVPENPKKVLHVKGLVIFGGGEIKSV